MTPRPPVNRGAIAGMLIVASIILCGGIGLGLGSLLGATALLAIAGVFAGLVLGFYLVYARFRDL
jgi:predicted ABC-type sugar transport system permease subunit